MKERGPIHTSFIYPPIPDRRFDWSAVRAASYEPGQPIGIGPTEMAAIEDLLEQEEDMEDEPEPATPEYEYEDRLNPAPRIEEPND